MHPDFTLRGRTLADLIPTPTAGVAARVRTVALVVGFAIFTALLAQVRISLSFTPVPITGQTLAVLLSGAALGWRRGAMSQLLYWAAGIFMPVAWYANDTTGASVSKGWHVATGTTAGYFFGFVLASAAVGWMAERGRDRNLATSVPAMLAGTAIIYICGATWLAHDLHIPVANGDANALAYGVTPFLIGDTIKLVLAGALTPAAWKLAPATDATGETWSLPPAARTVSRVNVVPVPARQAPPPLPSRAQRVRTAA